MNLEIKVISLLALAVIAIVGCSGASDDDDDISPANPEYTFDATLVDTFRIVSAGVAEDGDIIAEDDIGDATYIFEIYEVPGIPCVRQEIDDYSLLPEGAELPGKPGVFGIAYPDSASATGGPIMYLPHGNGSEALEQAAVTLLKDYPVEYESFYPLMSDMIDEYFEQTTQRGALKTIKHWAGYPLTTEFLSRGWTLVLPGNCWGDFGVGEGRVVDNFYNAPRWTRVFDREAIDFAREKHEGTNDIYAFGCSGGGARTTQQVLNTPQLFKAIVFDSPGDYQAGALAQPLPQNGQMIATLLPDYDALGAMTDYVINLCGSLEEVKDYSLGFRLGVDIFMDDTPILLGYALVDPVMQQEFFTPLADALSTPERYNNDLGEVRALDMNEHCPFKNIPEQRDYVIEWLTGIAGE